MISKPTVFVLGAGASMPYGFPSGKALCNSICNDTRNWPSFGIDTDIYHEFATALQTTKQSSVDAFLEHRQEFLAPNGFSVTDG
jgi:hypothetical protein